MSAKET